MQHAVPACQLERAKTPDSRQKSAPQVGTQCPNTTPWTPVSATAMEVSTTTARHTGPRNWLRSVEWLVAAGLHPKANQTTLAVAQDLCRRMDYSTGHVRYDLEGTAARLDIHRSNVARHVRYLRELGALVWVERGTRANIRKALGMGGYAATATVYAATIPAAYDHALGHQIIGTGYGARIVRDYRQMPDTRPPASIPNQAATPVDNASSGPVDNSAKRSLATPSLTSANEESKVQMVGGFNYTPHAGRRTNHAPTNTPNHGSNNDGHARRTPLQVAREIRETRRVRALTNWTQREGLRRLAYVLRPLFDRGLDSDQIAAELAGMCQGWRPAHPANYIRAALAQEAARLAAQEAADERIANSTWRDQAAQHAADLASLAALFGATEDTPARTDDDRRAARLDWNNWPEIADHYNDDPDDALDLYGIRLCAYAVKKSALTANAF